MQVLVCPPGLPEHFPLLVNYAAVGSSVLSQFPQVPGISVSSFLGILGRLARGAFSSQLLLLRGPGWLVAGPLSTRLLEPGWGLLSG